MATKYDKRIEELETRFDSRKVPVAARGPFIHWVHGYDPVDEGEIFKDIKQGLLERYNTVNGAEFLILHWGKESSKNAAQGDEGQGIQ